jgi:hypothetical protein
VCVEGPKEKLDTTAVSQVRSKTKSDVLVAKSDVLVDFVVCAEVPCQDC